MKNRKTRKVSMSFKGAKKMTVQSDRTKVDIENIKKSGIMPVDPNQLTFADVSTDFDYHQVMNKVAVINESFDELPSETRYFFKNDPGQLLEFVRDPANQEEAVKLGIIPQQPQKNDSKPITKSNTRKSSVDTGSSKSSEKTDEGEKQEKDS